MKFYPSKVSNAGEYKEAGLKYVSSTSLSVAIMALPFSIKICRTAIMVFLLRWLCEGGWRDKFLTIRQNARLQLIIVFFVIEILSVSYTNDNSACFGILFTLIGLGVVGLTLLMVLMTYSFYTRLVQKDYLFVTFIFLFCSLCITEAALELQKGIVFFALFFFLQAFSEKQMISRTFKNLIRAKG